MSLKVDLEYTGWFLPLPALKLWEPAVQKANQTVMNKTGAGSDFLGWLDLPVQSMEFLPEILKVTDDYRKDLDAVVVIGIGGSYLGTRAVLESLSGPLAAGRPGPEILYAGHHLNSPY